MKCYLKSLSLLLSFILIFGTFTGCNSSQVKETTAGQSEGMHLKVILGPEPETLDPAISLTVDVRSYLSHLFEGLTVIDKDGNVSPGCASKWTVNDDATQYIFTIDSKAVWSDGKPVTAEDFRYEWLRVLNPETGSGWASYLYYIKGAESYNKGECAAEDVGIDINDNGQLIVNLNSPCAFFTSMTAIQPYYPVRSDVAESNQDWAMSANTIVTNGAYNLNEWKHDQSLILDKNELFHKELNGNFDVIEFILMEDSSAAMNAFENNEADFISRVLTVDEMEQIATVNFCDYTITKFLSLNSKENKFSDIRVREAISLALNRKDIADRIGTGHAPLCSWLPRGFINPESGIDFRDEAEHVTYFSEEGDLEKAKELLSEAGYPNGEGFPEIDYLTNTSSLNVRLGEIVKEQLAQIGLVVNISTYEQKVFGEYRRNRKFDIVAASWAAEYPDISSYFYGSQSTDINNYASFADDQYDKLYTEALSLTDMNSRFALYHEQEDILMDSWYVLPLYSENSSYIVSESIDGFYFDITDCLNFNNAVRKEE